MSNQVIFKIENENGDMKQWKNVSIPLKYGKLLDEQLDHATVDLVRVKKKEFPLFSKASIEIIDGSGENNVETYLIANDNSFETPVGSGCYNHTLTLIELTKYLECFPLENLCFTNPRGQKINKEVTPSIDIRREGDSSPIDPSDETTTYIQEFNTYTTPILYGTQISLNDLKDRNGDGSTASYSADGTVTVLNANDIGAGKTYKISNMGKVQPSGKYINLKPGTNRIKYRYRFASEASQYWVETFDIDCVLYPVKNWTVEQVIQRILQVVEPLREGTDTQRFTFTVPSDKTEIFAQDAPEFTFTGMNLREALQTVGGFIHAEPRLTESNEIVFDFYGENKVATYKNYKTKEENPLNSYKYRTYQGAHSIEQACNTLDSNMQNLVNRIDSDYAVVGQPYKGGGQTLRTEYYTRFAEDDSTNFPTKYPIDDIKKFEVRVNGNSDWHDITNFVYEYNVYKWLSSYSDFSGGSKAYALWFSQSEKGIKGFFFKRPNAVDSSKERYTITNILNKVTESNKKSYTYNELQFRLTYTPIYNTRVRHSKQHINEWLKLPRTINYTQSDNSVETRYYGEHIKGAVERLGTIEKTVVMNMRHVDNIPKVGDLWDKDFYISSVFVEVQQDLFIVSCGLSKNFNRISKYIGANSHKRVYEISETMVQQRHSVYTDYIVFTSKNTSYTPQSSYKKYLGQKGVEAFYKIASSGKTIVDYTITSVMAKGSDKTGTVSINTVVLPVVSSSFGNTMEFTWEYEDNYSAGTMSIYAESGGVEGNFGQAVEYSDYYGRLYYYKFALLGGADTISTDANLFPLLGNPSFPAEEKKTVYGESIIVRKDSREALKSTYCIELVTDQSSFVIGSALARRNPLVYRDEKRPAPRLYVLKHRLNKFANKLILPEGEKYENDYAYNFGSVSWGLDKDKTTGAITGKIFSAGIAGTGVTGKAWCYAIPPYDGDAYNAMNEDGTISEVTPKLGGELLFGENIDIDGKTTVGAFNAYVVHDVYEYLKTKRTI
jgi:hypothetical protein